MTSGAMARSKSRPSGCPFPLVPLLGTLTERGPADAIREALAGGIWADGPRSSGLALSSLSALVAMEDLSHTVCAKRRLHGPWLRLSPPRHIPQAASRRGRHHTTGVEPSALRNPHASFVREFVALAGEIASPVPALGPSGTSSAGEFCGRVRRRETGS